MKLTDKELENLMKEYGFTKNQLIKLKEVKKNHGINYQDQLKELKRGFLIAISCFLIFPSFFYLVTDFSNWASILSTSLSLFFVFIGVFLFIPVSFTKRAYFFMKKNSIF